MFKCNSNIVKQIESKAIIIIFKSETKIKQKVFSIIKFIRMQKQFNFELNKGLNLEKFKLRYNLLASTSINFLQKRISSYISVFNSNSLSKYYNRSREKELLVLKKSKDSLSLFNILQNLLKNRINEFKYKSVLVSKIHYEKEFKKQTTIISNTIESNSNLATIISNNQINAIKLIVSKFIKFHQK